MDKVILENLINEGKSLSDIKRETDKSITSIRYWLKKYELKTKNSFKISNKKCEVCGNPTECGRKLCHTCEVKMVRLRQRIALIKYKGGKCVKCGYSDNISVLEFHHKDPTKKDFTLSSCVKSWKKMKNEVDKCDIYCSNCHRIEHSTNYWKKLLPYAKNYTGGNLDLKELLDNIVL